MESFSWFACDTDYRIRNGDSVYLLIPKEFDGGALEETCYLGDGHFGKKNVYELVTEWNRDFLDVLIGYPNRKSPKDEQLESIALAYKQGGDVLAQTVANQLFGKEHYMRYEWKRNIGIRSAGSSKSQPTYHTRPLP